MGIFSPLKETTAHICGLRGAVLILNSLNAVPLSGHCVLKLYNHVFYTADDFLSPRPNQ